MISPLWDRCSHLAQSDVDRIVRSRAMAQGQGALKGPFQRRGPVTAQHPKIWPKAILETGTRGCLSTEIWPRNRLWLRALSPSLLLLGSLRGRVPFVKAVIQWMLCSHYKNSIHTTDLPSTFLCYIKNKVSVHNTYKQLSCDDIWDTSSILKLILSILSFFFNK